jgi:hypothetical protein
MDLICINDTYSSYTLEFWAKNGVWYPWKDRMYSLRNCQRHTNGKIGIRVNEIINPAIPVKHNILTQITVEPTFNISRFALLTGETLTKEIIEQVEHEISK